MASIKDVAKLAGVAVSTASRVLTGDGYSSPETREKVERAAKDLSYIPNGIARAMRGQGTRAVALLVYDTLNPFFANLAAGVEEETYHQGFNVLMCSTQPWKSAPREESYMDLLFQRRIDGLITQHKFSSLEYRHKLQQQRIPVVRLVSAQPGFPADLFVAIQDKLPTTWFTISFPWGTGGLQCSARSCPLQWGLSVLKATTGR